MWAKKCQKQSLFRKLQGAIFFKCLFATFVLFVGLFLSVVVSAEPHIKYKNFDRQFFESVASSTCRHVREGLRIDVTSPSPEIFTNVKNFLIVSNITGGLRGIETISQDSLSVLAGCTLWKRFSTGAQGISPMSIGLYGSLADLPVLSDDDLVIFISAKFSDVSIKSDDGNKIFVLQAQYFRSGQQQKLEDMRYQCAEAFPYVADYGENLAIAMRKCLYMPYVSRAYK